MKERWKYLSFRMKILGILGAVLLLAGFLLLFWTGHEFIKIFYGFLLLLYLYVGYRNVLRPLRNFEHAVNLFSEGYMFQEIFTQSYAISPSLEAALYKIQDSIKLQELLNSSNRQAKYIALQNQINPHFLYNTLEGIRSEALLAGVDTVAEMTETLAKFFRYTISNLDQLVPLESELSNVENYYRIQQYRFGEKIHLRIEFLCEKKEVLSCKIPKLTLQPVVENAIRHGIERKMGQGTIVIKINCTGERLLLRISDDGVGMEEEQVEKINQKLRVIRLDSQEQQDESQGGIAIVNVNNRIKLLFGEEFGMYYYSRPNAGTDVDITFPYKI